jgi:nucleoid DNA-binding protein
VVVFGRMKKSDLIKQMASQHGVEPGTAADQMDKAVNQLLRALRSGHPARLPGLGTISPGKRWVFRQEPNER